MSEGEKEAARQTLREKFQQQRRRIEELTERVGELETALAGAGAGRGFEGSVHTASVAQVEPREGGEDGRSARGSLRTEIERLASDLVKAESRTQQLTDTVAARNAAIERLTEENRALTKRANADRSLEQERTALAGELGDARRTIGRLEGDKVGLEIELGAARKTAAEAEARVKEAEGEKERFRELFAEADARLRAEADSSQSQFQQLLETEDRINELSLANADLVKENVQLKERLRTEQQRTPTPSTDLEGEVATLRKEVETAHETIRGLREEVGGAREEEERRRREKGAFEEELERELGVGDVEGALRKIREMRGALRSAERENRELGVRVQQGEKSRTEASEAMRRIAEVESRAEMVEARLGYLKTLVFQLLTAPLSQREEIVRVIGDVVGFSEEEKGIIGSSPANSSSLTSRILYALDPFV